MKTELRILFYSPIAWLILIVFALQAGIEFSQGFAEALRSQSLGYSPWAPSMRLFGGYGGVVSKMLDNLYLYIPLLTMGLMSRELSTGSIKLLYSSPVSNVQIILGKYLSVLVYALIFVAIFAVQFVFTYVFIKDMDWVAVMVTMLGLYLTVCAYAAIGLFMSTITHYQVVAAIGTLAVLTVLNFVGRIGQEIDFVRDITYWLSISGRSSTFTDGMINSSDVLYFLLVIALFITLSVIKLHGERSKATIAGNTIRYGSVMVVVLMLGYLSSRPTMIHYFDATNTERNTLTKESQDVVAKLTGGLTLTTYVNVLEENYYNGTPRMRNWDIERFEQYIRFKPEMKIKYVYYYHKAHYPFLEQRYPGLNDRERLEAMCEANDEDPDFYLPYEEVAKTVDLSGEDYRFVRVFERESGERVFLRLFNDQSRHPSEAEISTALKTLLGNSPSVGFVTGHDERSIDNMGGRGYGVFACENTFRYSLHNQGFKVETVSFEQPIDAKIGSLVISDMRSSFSPVEMQNYLDYLARGGNLIVMGEPKRQANMNPIIAPLGLRFTDQMLVQPTKDNLADLVVGNFNRPFAKLSTEVARALRNNYCMTAPSTCGIEQIADTGYAMMDVVLTDSMGVWNERQTTDFIDDRPLLDPRSGEVEKCYSLMKYLSREVNGREQRIFVVGDSDCISGDELTINRNGIKASNFTLLQSMFRMMSYGEFPLETNRVRPPDDKIYLDQDDGTWLKALFIGVIPALLLAISLGIWIRRRKG